VLPDVPAGSVPWSSAELVAGLDGEPPRSSSSVVAGRMGAVVVGAGTAVVVASSIRMGDDGDDIRISLGRSSTPSGTRTGSLFVATTNPPSPTPATTPLAAATRQLRRFIVPPQC
jgi:hypothetical protein